jgi:hypothetical protein
MKRLGKNLRRENQRAPSCTNDVAVLKSAIAFFALPV